MKAIQIYYKCLNAVCACREAVSDVVRVELPARPLHVHERVSGGGARRGVRPARLSARLPQRQAARLQGCLRGHPTGGATTHAPLILQ